MELDEIVLPETKPETERTPFEGDAVFTHRALPALEVRLQPFFAEALDLPF